MYGREIDLLIWLLLAHFQLKLSAPFSSNMQPTAVVLLPTTVAVAATMFLSTILCFRKKKKLNKKQKGAKNFEIKVGKFGTKNELNKKKSPITILKKEEIAKIKDERNLKETTDIKERISRESKEKLPIPFGSMDPNDEFSMNGPIYPYVPEPTPSARQKREEALEKDKQKKIEEGFYQSRSDEDDTLEPIKSLEKEETVPEDLSVTSKKALKKIAAGNDLQLVNEDWKPGARHSTKDGKDTKLICKEKLERSKRMASNVKKSS